ncbi:hypothetical protein HDU76_001643 [Blyttiomyces sp. JEL0837]|nr:hypothetical protein HDU76_001643 [Blyttiomyces sp. JEL0837]
MASTSTSRRSQRSLAGIVALLLVLISLSISPVTGRVIDNINIIKAQRLNQGLSCSGSKGPCPSINLIPLNNNRGENRRDDVNPSNVTDPGKDVKSTSPTISSSSTTTNPPSTTTTDPPSTTTTNPPSTTTTTNPPSTTTTNPPSTTTDPPSTTTTNPSTTSTTSSTSKSSTTSSSTSSSPSPTDNGGGGGGGDNTPVTKSTSFTVAIAGSVFGLCLIAAIGGIIIFRKWNNRKTTTSSRFGNRHASTEPLRATTPPGITMNNINNSNNNRLSTSSIQMHNLNRASFVRELHEG